MKGCFLFLFNVDKAHFPLHSSYYPAESISQFFRVLPPGYHDIAGSPSKITTLQLLREVVEVELR